MLIHTIENFFVVIVYGQCRYKSIYECFGRSSVIAELGEGDVVQYGDRDQDRDRTQKRNTDGDREINTVLDHNLYLHLQRELELEGAREGTRNHNWDRDHDRDGDFYLDRERDSGVFYLSPENAADNERNRTESRSESNSNAESKSR